MVNESAQSVDALANLLSTQDICVGSRQSLKDIYQTDYNNGDLLQRLSLRITVRLLIDRAFEHTHGHTTA